MIFLKRGEWELFFEKIYTPDPLSEKAFAKIRTIQPI